MMRGHITIVGRTGSGKSVAAAEYVDAYHESNPDHGIVILNPKASKDWDARITPVKRGKQVKYKAGRLINWHVLPYEHVAVNVLLWDIYESGKPCLVVIDEGQNITDSKYPAAGALWTQGRELGVSVITCCQRPSRISISAITQASILRIFNVIGEDDIKTLDGYMDISLTQYIRPAKTVRGELIDGARLNQYESIEYDVASGVMEIKKPILFKKVKVLPYDSRFIKNPITKKWLLLIPALVAVMLF